MSGKPTKDTFIGKSALDYAVKTRDSNVLGMVHRAIEHNEVMLAYQPIVQTQSTDRVAFYEGLLRVLDETGRVIPAVDFISTVEETEYGRKLDCLSLKKGLTELHRTPGLRLSINMSARSIGYPRWMRILSRGLEDDPTIGERLILEITEHSAMLVPEIVVSFMSHYQRLGVAFAIDDFGSGYTALRHFKDFSFDILKIDGQFIHKIASDPDNQVLVRAMVSIAEQFDMFTVAESVEHAQDAHTLAQLGLTCLQGRYFGAPTVNPPWRAPAARERSA